MGNWKDLLRSADHETTLKRAHDCLKKNTVYKLGKGGINPTKPLTEQCDCSGFVAWAIGIPRELPPRSGKWLQTTTYWQGGGNVGRGLFDQVSAHNAIVGDIFVYPDVGRRQGHMGIISEVTSGRPTKVIHCSKSNDRNGDAIQETHTAIFNNNAKSRIMRIDFAALRDLFDLPDPNGNDNETELQPSNAQLHHPILAFDNSLQLVVKGLLILEPTGDEVGGCGALHDALNQLAVVNPKYGVDLGDNQRYRGFYGPQTAKAIKKFQKDRGLHATGETDFVTLMAIDKALLILNTPDVERPMNITSLDNRWHVALIAVETTGASTKTGGQDGLPAGVESSRQMARTDLKRVLALRNIFQSCAEKLDVPAALIAAIASRESRCGNVLASDGTGDRGNGWGIMQVDKRYHHPVGAPDSLEHIEQAIGILVRYREQVAERHPSWNDSNILKGAVAAYNSGVSNVQTVENMDIGTTGDDYSSDVMARAQFYVTDFIA